MYLHERFVCLAGSSDAIDRNTESSHRRVEYWSFPETGPEKVGICNAEEKPVSLGHGCNRYTVENKDVV